MVAGVLGPSETGWLCDSEPAAGSLSLAFSLAGGGKHAFYLVEKRDGVLAQLLGPEAAYSPSVQAQALLLSVPGEGWPQQRRGGQGRARPEVQCRQRPSASPRTPSGPPTEEALLLQG